MIYPFANFGTSDDCYSFCDNIGMCHQCHPPSPNNNQRHPSLVAAALGLARRQWVSPNEMISRSQERREHGGHAIGKILPDKGPKDQSLLRHVHGRVYKESTRAPGDYRADAHGWHQRSAAQRSATRDFTEKINAGIPTFFSDMAIDGPKLANTVAGKIPLTNLNGFGTPDTPHSANLTRSTTQTRSKTSLSRGSLDCQWEAVHHRCRCIPAPVSPARAGGRDLHGR